MYALVADVRREGVQVQVDDGTFRRVAVVRYLRQINQLLMSFDEIFMKNVDIYRNWISWPWLLETDTC